MVLYPGLLHNNRAKRKRQINLTLMMHDRKDFKEEEEKRKEEEEMLVTCLILFFHNVLTFQSQIQSASQIFTLDFVWKYTCSRKNYIKMQVVVSD